MPVTTQAATYRWGTLTPAALYRGTLKIWPATPAGDQTYFVETFDEATWGAWTKAVGSAGTISVTAVPGYGEFRQVAPDWMTSGSAAVYRSVPAADVDVTARFAVGNAWAMSVGLIARVPPADTTATTGIILWTNPDGTCELAQDGTRISASAPAFVKADNQYVNARLRVQGSAVSGRLWLDGATEPAGWTVTATATTRLTAGNVAVRAIGAATYKVTFDHVTVTSPN